MKFDAATQEFMAKVADDAPEHTTPREALSAAKKLVRLGQNPVEALPKMLISSAAKELFKEGAMPPLRVFGTLNQHYGKSWWGWEPETIWETLRRDQGIDADDALKNMLQAFQTIVTTNAPFEHWHVFEKVGHALNQNPVEFQILQPLELDEIALTMKILRVMRPAQGFENEIYGYTAAAAKSAGVVYLPAEYFGLSQIALDELQQQYDLALSESKRVAEYWPHFDGKSYPRSTGLRHQLEMLWEIKGYVEEKTT